MFQQLYIIHDLFLFFYQTAIGADIIMQLDDVVDATHTGKSLSEALLFAEHGVNMLCTITVLNVRNNFCTQHVLPRFELGIFMY